MEENDVKKLIKAKFELGHLIAMKIISGNKIFIPLVQGLLVEYQDNFDERFNLDDHVYHYTVNEAEKQNMCQKCAHFDPMGSVCATCFAHYVEMEERAITREISKIRAKALAISSVVNGFNLTWEKILPGYTFDGMTIKQSSSSE